MEGKEGGKGNEFLYEKMTRRGRRSGSGKGVGRSLRIRLNWEGRPWGKTRTALGLGGEDLKRAMS